MRSARAVGVGLLLSFLLWPEIPRYRAERQLGRASAAFEYVLDRPTEIKGAPAILDRIRGADEQAPALGVGHLEQRAVGQELHPLYTPDDRDLVLVVLVRARVEALDRRRATIPDARGAT